MSYSGMLGPRLRRQWIDGVEVLRILPRRSWKILGIAFVFLAFKEMQGWRHLFGNRSWFDDIEAALFAAFWLFWFVAFFGEFLGSEMVYVARGELVISRGFGRVRRTFRYPVGRIHELVSGDPTDENGKSHLHHIFLKPKAGAARFIYGGKTVYFADSLDEPEGEIIVTWLRPKLPRSAAEMAPLELGGTANLAL